MLRRIFTALVLSLVLLFSIPAIGSNNSRRNHNSEGQTGTLQKMIVQNGTVGMDLDVDRFTGDGSLAARVEHLRFDVAANSFFTIFVFNDLLRGPEHGSMALVPRYSSVLPSVLSASINQLVVEKLPSGERFDLAVRDAKTGFTFFNIEGHQYNYDATGQLLTVQGGRLLISKQFADALGRPADAGTPVGRISIGAAMQPIEINHFVNGELKWLVMPPLRGAVSGTNPPDLVPGPDVIVGDIEDIEEDGNTASQVALDVGTDSCNNGDQPVDWFAFPQNDHPVVPQNLYRMSAASANNDRIEQIGQSWMKHTFEPLEETVCGTCNAGNDTNGQPIAMDHTSHNHDGVSRRIHVNIDDLNQNLNQGSIYFAEAAYIAPSEYTWCQSHPDQCNMFNNVSYRQFSVTGITPPFSFSPVASTVRMQPAIMAWTGATVNQVQPDPGNDGLWFMGYKVTNPTTGIWHYEYALYNMNLDRAIQSFSVPLGSGTNISNIGFHAPPQEPGWAYDETFMNQGYSSTPWTVTQASDSITWNSETFAQNQNANAIRFGTLYNLRFDADKPPGSADATVGFFKTGSPMTVAIQAPAGGTPTPTPTASPTPSPTSTATATPTPTATVTSTPTTKIRDSLLRSK